MSATRFSKLTVMTAFAMCLLCGLAQGATVFVKADATGANNGTSWADAFTQVQPALNAAAGNDEVWVAAGTYVENITLKDGVALYGGFAGNETDLTQRNWVTDVTILDGNQAGSVVTSPSGATAATRIDGFTIRNGTGTLSGSRYGGGIYCRTCSPTIAGNIISGNTAIFGAGIYCESSSPVIANNTICGNAASYGGGAIYCTSSSVTIANNTIRGNTATYDGGGINCDGSSSPTITGNTISGNTANYGGGIYSPGASAAIIANNVISANAVSGYGGGLFCGSLSTISNNTIVGNTAFSNGGGISLPGGTTVTNSIIAFNSSGIHCSGEAPTLRSNCVFGNGTRDYSGVGDPTGTDGNIAADPRLASVSYGNTHIQPDSPCVSSGDDGATGPDWADIDGQARTIGTHVDIGADESDGTVWPAGPYAIVRVNPNGNDADDGSSWTTAKRTVQAGIDTAALRGGEVWVQAGIYYERITVPPFAYVYGGFAGTESARDSRGWLTNVTVLDGQQGGSVATIRAGQGVSTVDGFIIRNGTGTLSGPEFYGGGIYCLFSSVTLANNTITANTATYGGGVYCSYSSPTISNNTVTGNTAVSGGGVHCSYSSPTITDNMITANVINGSYGVRGGGIYCGSSSATIESNVIAGNVASGSPARGGGICCEWTPSPTIANNMISANRAVFGGGIASFGSSPIVANNTIASGSAGYGGGVFCAGGSPTIANTIIAFGSSGIYRSPSGTLFLQYNCVYGNADYNYFGLSNPTGTDGNISADPLFIRLPSAGSDGQWNTADDDYGDLRLQPGSPPIDAGDNAAVPADALDLDGDGNVTEPMPFDMTGNPRFVDVPFVTDTGLGTPPIVDMGAYEHVPTARADFDDDLDVDGDDLAAFETCASGPGVEMSAACAAKDLDRDNDVDQADFGLFQRCLSGSGVEADLNCAE